jgi:hypothetical protein
VEDYDTNEAKDDPSLVKIFGMIYWRDIEDNYVNQSIGVHRCTDADYKMFHPVVKDQVIIFDRLKQNRTMWCLNDKDIEGKPLNTSLYGKTDIVPHRRLDIIFTPCVPEQLTKANAHL